MKKTISLLTVFLLFFLFINGCKIDEGTGPDTGSEITITGQVIDALSEEGIYQAEVKVLDGSTQLGIATTDQSGNYSLKVTIDEDKALNIEVTMPDYTTESKTVNAKMNQNVTVPIIRLGSTAVESGTAVIAGNVIDSKYGEPLENADVKFFDSGSIISVATTDSEGSFTDSISLEGIKELTVITVKAAYLADTSFVTAVSGEVRVMEDIKLYPLSNMISGDAASIYLMSQSLESIGVAESGSPETAQITFEVQDSSGNPIDLDHQVAVNFRFGSNPNGGEILAPGTVDTDGQGLATVSLTSGTKAGAVQIIAEINFNGQTIISKPINITIHGGLPDLAHFSIGAEKNNYPYYNKINYSASITALIGDKYSNPVRPGTAVYFSTTAGVIQGSALTDDLGLASVTLLSGNPKPNDPVLGEGFFYVTANTIDENEQSISAPTQILFSGEPIITISPETVDVADSSSQLFTYTVMDENGNPLAEGNSYKVSIETSGDAEVSGDIDVKMEDVQFGSTSFSFTLTDTKPGEVNPSPITIIIETSGPNGTASEQIEGITR
ncbi:MAG: hypothetical protein ABFS12_13690 [Bacteroidota bacterium]